MRVWLFLIIEKGKKMLNYIDSYVGKKLKLQRKVFGLTQADLGNRVDISFQQIQKYETGQNRISASMLFKISNVLEVSVEYFFQNKMLVLIIKQYLSK